MSNINLLKIFAFEPFKFIILLRTYSLDRHQTALSKNFFHSLYSCFISSFVNKVCCKTVCKFMLGYRYRACFVNFIQNPLKKLTYTVK